MHGQVAEAMQKYDLDKSGSLNVEEFLDMCAVLLLVVTLEP